MLGWLKKLFGYGGGGKPRRGRAIALQRRQRSGGVHGLKSVYDAAQTVDDNTRHWANVDALSAKSANSLEVRKALRERARYESANNSYCRGMVLTQANNLIGTGPRLQIIGGQQIERAFAEWSRSVGLAEKLRTAAQAKIVDGESFLMLTNNPAADGDVKLGVQVVECDRVTSPTWELALKDHIDDGVERDASGQVIAYYILDEHPGDTYFVGKYKRVEARFVRHWFRADRPGQIRGVPEITPALPLFAQLRRYTLAVIAAAETAADFAAVLQSEGPADADEDDPEPMDTIEIEQRMMTVLPKGWRLGQVQSEQPTTTYPDFKAEILNEIARCQNMPYNVAAGNSSNYNYASGRLDHQVYFKSIRVDRHHCENVVLSWIFQAWLEEASLSGVVLASMVDDERWFWDGMTHVDPTKEATADQIGLATNTMTLAEIYAERGLDWEEQLRQRAKERQMEIELGLTQPAATAPSGDVEEIDDERGARDAA